MSSPTNFRALGSLVLGSRLRRLGDRMAHETTTLYREHGFPFEPRWFLVFYELAIAGPAAVMELAARVGITHTAVAQVANEMIAAGLLAQDTVTTDRRKRVLTLAPDGRTLFGRLQPLWVDLQKATDEVLAEAGGALPEVLDRVEAALDRLPLRERLAKCTTLQALDRVQVVAYETALRAQWQAILEAVPDATARLTHAEYELLRDPAAARGVWATLARLDGDIVGACAVLYRTRRRPEVAVLAVVPEARRRRVGRKLVLACVDEARRAGAVDLLARSAPCFDSANRLFRSLGFAYAGPDEAGDGVQLVLHLDREGGGCRE